MLPLLALAAALGRPAEGTAGQPEIIPTVTMTPAGPAENLPTSGAFYLSGTIPKDVLRVYPVFVRVSYNPWGITGSNTCAQAERALSKLKYAPREEPGAQDGDAAKKDEASEDPADRDRDIPLLEQKVDIQSIDELWEKPSEQDAAGEYERLDRNHNAYVPVHWHRTKEEIGKDVSFKVAVSQPRFFRPGATFCLLVYHQREESKEEKAIAGYLVENQQKRLACADQKCKDEADGEVVKKLTALTARIPEDKGEQLLKLAQAQLIQPVEVLSTLRASLTSSLDASRWKPRPKIGTADQWSIPREPLDVRGDLLGRLIVEMLIQRGDLRRVDVGDHTEYRTRENENAATIEKIGLRADLSVFDLLGRKKDKDHLQELKVPASALEIPGTDLTLQETIELARGRIKPASTFVALTDVPGAIAPAAGAPVDPLEPFPPAQVAALHKQVRKLKTAVTQVCAAAVAGRGAAAAAKKEAEEARKKAEEARKKAEEARKKAPTKSATTPQAAAAPATTPQDPASSEEQQAVLAKIVASERMPLEASLQALAGWWLEKAALSDCEPFTRPAKKPPEMDGLEALDHVLDTAVDAQTSWKDNKDKLVIAVRRVLPPQLEGRATIETRFSQQTFVDHFITPFLGYTTITAPASNIGMFYAGVQLHLWANPVGEPMWSNEAGDLRRAVALELGIGLTAAETVPEVGQVGENNRYSGLGPLPPLFAGLSLQLVPYVTFSAGISVLERRKSALATESPIPMVSPYFGLTAQANFVTLIRDKFGGAGKATQESKK